ncbi:MAG: cytochrome c oxidase subunit II [Actinomycetota bacterium]|nr:cytochrome c oxidase subunit II [Actinomycetota bacterium]
MRRSRALLLLVAAAAAALFPACSSGSPSTLQPRGPAAQRIDGLWWFMFWIALGVFAVVIGMLLFGLFRRRKGGDPIARGGGERAVVLLGIVAPAIILTTLFVVSLRDLNALSAPAKSDAMTVSVIGHDWWWEVRYPEQHVVTANEIHIPTGTQVLLHLSTGDVIHSFWVPQLSEKTDMIPGKTNRMLLEADRPGIYRGQCAEFCGLEHARMSFLVIAEPPSQFQSWLAAESQPIGAVAGAAAQGERVFLTSTCVSCHTIQGTSAVATDGPDLTHFGSRRTIAANSVPNTGGNLAAWIEDPQGVKPGALMPPAVVEPRQLQALVTFLEGLK